MERRRVTYQETALGLAPEYAKGVVDQQWEDYTAQDHQTWVELLGRLKEVLPARACSAYLQNFEGLNFGDQIPKFTELNQMLSEKTGWRIVAVDGLLSGPDFFDHLANRRFPVSWWIRPPEKMDYIAEPDLFHDLVGHIPLLLNQDYADAVQAFGEKSIELLAHDPLLVPILGRFYWFTVEFGLMQDMGETKIVGAGILSSPGEIVSSLSDPSIHREFDIATMLRTRFKIDNYQTCYFVAPSLKEIKEALSSLTVEQCALVLAEENGV